MPPSSPDHDGARASAQLLGLAVVRSSRVRPETVAVYSPEHRVIALPVGLPAEEEDHAIMWAIQRYHICHMSGIN